MAFTEPRALYRNKLTLIFGFGLILLSIYLIAEPVSGPAVNGTDPKLSQIQGTLYYGGRPFTGNVYLFFDSGIKQQETPYFRGKQDGVMKTWYPDEKPEQQRLFLNGKKQGIHRGWWPNGKPKFEYEFTDDEHNGTAKEWFNTGQPSRAFHYTMGHEDGLQQMWWEDGKVRANYVVKDGQQYGIIGRKLCKNVYK